jgi:hypothetical protein
MPELHPGWEHLSRLPLGIVPCPNCGSPQMDKEHNWRWDYDVTKWLCRRPSCMERGKPIGLTQGQRLYPPTAQ